MLRVQLPPRTFRKCVRPLTDSVRMVIAGCEGCGHKAGTSTSTRVLSMLESQLRRVACEVAPDEIEGRHQTLLSRFVVECSFK
jgi:hypothetical protein